MRVTELLTKNGLTLLRRHAHRRGCWYLVLSKLERSVMDLTIRYIDEVRSMKLALVISRIVCKLLKTSQSFFSHRVVSIGSTLAEKLSHIAVSWGYKRAEHWKHDSHFIRYLGMVAITNPWRSCYE